MPFLPLRQQSDLWEGLLGNFVWELWGGEWGDPNPAELCLYWPTLVISVVYCCANIFLFPFSSQLDGLSTRYLPTKEIVFLVFQLFCVCEVPSELS